MKAATTTTKAPVSRRNGSKGRPLHPLDSIQWVDPKTLHANDWNPNHIFGPELELLIISILEDGWTQPIVAYPDGTIVDGFHRWWLACTDTRIKMASGGLVPVVFLDQNRSLADRKFATVRHNRARGQHGVLKMADIIRDLVAGGLTREEICKRMGLEREEFERLADLRSSPDLRGKDSFGKGWVPTPEK